MKKIITSAIVLSTLGCITAPPKTVVELRRQELKSCVKEFLHEDLGPVSSLRICKTVFKKPRDLSPKAQGRYLNY